MANVNNTKALLLSASSALNLKVLYCLYPVAEAHVLATSRDNLAYRSRHAARRIVFPINDKSRTNDSIAYINQYCEDEGIDIIIPGDIGTTAFLAAHGDRIIGPALFAASPEECLDAIHDKWSFAKRLLAHGLATPRTRLIESADKLDEAAAADIGFPMMVKPLNCESSHGVVKMTDYAALRRHVDGNSPYSEPPLIMQEFIDGHDIDISVLADHGQIVASAVQYWSPEGELVFREEPDMYELASAIVRLFDFHGVAHFDMRRDRHTGKVYVVECNPRFWYTLPAAMWVGLNFVEAGINAALGRPYDHLGPALGSYRLPSDVVRGLKKPGRLVRMTRRNWKGFFQPLLDPNPHIAAVLSRQPPR